MSIIRQLELTVVTLVLMAATASAGVGWGIFVVAAIGGYAISQYDSGNQRGRSDGGRQQFASC
jgi:hypothetical protein